MLTFLEYFLLRSLDEGYHLYFMINSPVNRVQRWSDLFGIDPGSSKARFWNASKESKALVEHRVLKQDVNRTRSDELFFNNSRMRQLLEQCLLCFCAYYRFEYMQGLNEILAPLLAINIVATPGQYDLINDPKNRNMRTESEDSGSSSQCTSRCMSRDDQDSGETILEDLHDLIVQYNASFIFFERIVTSLNPVIFSEDGIAALQAQLASFHNLLFYVDAELAVYLFREGMRSDVYAQAWFITLFCRRTPVELALYVLDNLLPQHECPCFVIILAVAFLVGQREKLMHGLNKENLPSLLVNLNFQTATDVDRAVSLAQALRCTIPASMLRAMNAIGFDPSLPPIARETALKDLFRRPSVRISAIDVACRATGVLGAHIPKPDWSESRPCPGNNVACGSGGGSNMKEEEDEDDDEDDNDDDDDDGGAGNDLHLLPLAKVISNGRDDGNVMTQGAPRVTSPDGHSMDFGKTKEIDEICWPRHNGYLLLDCRDPLARARRKFALHSSHSSSPISLGKALGEEDDDAELSFPAGHIAEEVFFEGVVIVPPEVIVEVCELAHKKGLLDQAERYATPTKQEKHLLTLRSTPVGALCMHCTAYCFLLSGQGCTSSYWMTA